MPDEAEYRAAGLFDRAPGAPVDRLALLDWLAAQGFTIAEMVEAESRSVLFSLASDRALGTGREYSPEEAAAAAGLEPEVIETILRAAGFVPESARLTDASIRLFREFGVAREIFSDAQALHFTRVMGSALGRIAEAANSLFLVDIVTPMMATSAGELEIAQKGLAAIESLNGVIETLGTMFRLHMIDATDRSRRARRDVGDSDLVPMAIGFIDLVGFTSLTATATPRELLALLLEFESRAYDIVTGHGGRVVKLIGDEVMFTAIEAGQACEIALRLFEELGARSEVTPRGGIAFGEVLGHGGDYYGPIVNLASRVADIAVPWEILVTEGVAERVADSYSITPAGRRLLKGFDQTVTLASLGR